MIIFVYIAGKIFFKKVFQWCKVFKELLCVNPQTIYSWSQSSNILLSQMLQCRKKGLFISIQAWKIRGQALK